MSLIAFYVDRTRLATNSIRIVALVANGLYHRSPDREEPTNERRIIVAFNREIELRKKRVADGERKYRDTLPR